MARIKPNEISQARRFRLADDDGLLKGLTAAERERRYELEADAARDEAAAWIEEAEAQ